MVLFTIHQKINLIIYKIKSSVKTSKLENGKKITIDSATMMNKIYELIEARNIFNLSYNKISIFNHPKSYVHAIIKFKDGLTKLLVHNRHEDSIFQFIIFI